MQFVCFVPSFQTPARDSYFKTQPPCPPDALLGFLGWVLCPFPVAHQHPEHASVILRGLPSSLQYQLLEEEALLFISKFPVLSTKLGIEMLTGGSSFGIRLNAMFYYFTRGGEESYYEERVRKVHVGVSIAKITGSIKMVVLKQRYWG